MQKILAFEDISAEEILQANKSIESMIDSIAMLESTLKEKIDLFAGCICKKEE